MEDTIKAKETYKQKLLKTIKKSVPQIIGAIAGASVGFSYYYFIGCASGTCGIVSDPWLSTLVGGFLGYAIGNVYSMKDEK